jgi:hypothetical protein
VAKLYFILQGFGNKATKRGIFAAIPKRRKKIINKRPLLIK